MLGLGFRPLLAQLSMLGCEEVAALLFLSADIISPTGGSGPPASPPWERVGAPHRLPWRPALAHGSQLLVRRPPAIEKNKK